MERGRAVRAPRVGADGRRLISVSEARWPLADFNVSLVTSTPTKILFHPQPSPKRQRAGALQDASRSPWPPVERASVLECGGSPPLFARPEHFQMKIILRPRESGVAAAALPPQSMKPQPARPFPYRSRRAAALIGFFNLRLVTSTPANPLADGSGSAWI